MHRRYEEKQADPFYSSGPWRRVREQALQRDNWYCQDCLAEYRAGTRRLQDIHNADMVHHIVAYQQAPEMGLDMENLVSLCSLHHERRHPDRRSGVRSSAPERRFRVISV